MVTAVNTYVLPPSAVDETVTLGAVPPLYLPFYNEWGSNAYYFWKPFCFAPFGIWAGSTSGSPVVLGQGLFVGFMNETGGTYAYDGAGKLTVTVPAGQELYVAEGGDPFEAWADYNRIILARQEAETPGASRPQAFWSELEYCTWVDQKHEAGVMGEHVVQLGLSEKYVYDYMKRVRALGMPAGKLTIDDGWDYATAPDGRRIYGNWDVDRTRFPHFERMVHDMAEEGFKPGLWFVPFAMTPSCRLAEARPDLIGHTWSPNPAGEAVRQLHYIVDDDALETYYKNIFDTYINMGFRKFKLDMSYGCKRDMKPLMARIYRIIKDKDPTVEVETHMPDIFLARFGDTVRINDVVFDDAGRWRAVTAEHWRVCRYSSEKILNLDHIGTNTPDPREEDYVEHARLLLSLKGGYPCVSLLPDVFGGKTADWFAGAIREWRYEE